MFKVHSSRRDIVVSVMLSVCAKTDIIRLVFSLYTVCA